MPCRFKGPQIFTGVDFVRYDCLQSDGCSGGSLLIVRRLPALALSVNTSNVTAISNDYGFESVFARQIEGLGSPGDVAIGISTSGESENVLQGISIAKKLGLHTVGFTGTPGGKLKHAKDLDLCVSIPSSETPRIQECHILVAHIVCELVEQEVFPEI